jgi:hypothetical protein
MILSVFIHYRLTELLGVFLEPFPSNLSAIIRYSLDVIGHYFSFLTMDWNVIFMQMTANAPLPIARTAWLERLK